MCEVVAVLPQEKERWREEEKRKNGKIKKEEKAREKSGRKCGCVAMGNR